MGELDDFENSLIKRGRDPDTAALYKLHVQKAIENDAEDLLARFRNHSLSPNTKRSIKAALSAWARFTKDVELKELLEDYRLPPATRVHVKVPLTDAEWRALKDILRVQEEKQPVDAAIALMALRGFRIGDVLRMRRADIINALQSGVLSFVAKGNKRLEFGMMKPLRPWFQYLASIKGWKQVVELIGPSDRAAKMCIRRRLARLAVEAGIDSPVYPHKLRRTVAVWFLNTVHGDLMKLKSWMQWASINVASTYVDYQNREALDQLAEDAMEDE